MRTLATLTIVLTVVLAARAARPAGDTLRDEARRVFAPLPAQMTTPDNPLTPEKVALGRRLFFEWRASVDGTVSCSRCHQPGLYSTDALPKAIGAQHRVNPRNAPVIFNAALQFAEHWRGDRKSVEDQATQALTGPASFGNPTPEAAMARLKAIPGYRELFARAFPGEADPITAENWGKAIGAYERTLVTPAPFDAYLGGDDNALNAEAKAGLHDFMQLGCAGCHNGAGVGGTMFRKFGMVEDYWKATGSREPDKGRFDVTHSDADLYVFKVPILRNVARTPPYFHDGSVATLPEAVRVMARVQLGRTLTEAQTTQLVAFLDSLTGKVPESFATAVPLPPAEFPASAPAR
ncbi:MAG TPA: cytochrome c peroxidase [Methylomirabilota bacterium]|nr:cytochrome c peroxidase [Methylomirabilota bacterium]